MLMQQTHTSARLIKLWSCAVYFASFISNRSKQRVKRRDWLRAMKKSSNIQKTIGTGAFGAELGSILCAGISRELRSWNSSATLSRIHLPLPLPLSHRRFTVGGHPRAFIYFHAVRMPHVASSPDFRARASSETKRGGEEGKRGALEDRKRDAEPGEGARVREGWDSASGYTLGS